jgi:hypothetical protein
MSREELLGWIGLFLGIPAFALFVREDVLAGSLAMFIVAGLVTTRWLFTRPEFTILEVEKTLTFEDPQSRHAHLEQRQTVRANHRGLIEYCFRGIGSDGPKPMTITIDNVPPDRVKQIGGAGSACKLFAQPLQWRQTFIIILRIDVIDAFGGNPEGLIHEVPYTTKNLRMKVKFHPQKPGRAPKLTLRYVGNLHKTLAAPALSPDGLEIETELKRLKRGAQYQLEWEW